MSMMRQWAVGQDFPCFPLFIPPKYQCVKIEILHPVILSAWRTICCNFCWQDDDAKAEQNMMEAAMTDSITAVCVRALAEAFPTQVRYPSGKYHKYKKQGLCSVMTSSVRVRACVSLHAEEVWPQVALTLKRPSRVGGALCNEIKRSRDWCVLSWSVSAYLPGHTLYPFMRVCAVRVIQREKERTIEQRTSQYLFLRHTSRKFRRREPVKWGWGEDIQSTPGIREQVH